MSIQQLINLSVTVTTGKERKYTGRFLGFIKDSEFNAMVQNPDKVPNRLESKATQPIMEVAAKFDELVGHRLIMSVKKIDNANVLKRMLYITEGLEVIDLVAPRSEKEDEKKNKKITLGKVTFKSTTEEVIEVEEAE